MIQIQLQASTLQPTMTLDLTVEGVIFFPPEGSMLSKNGAYITNAYQAFRSDQMQ